MLRGLHGREPLFDTDPPGLAARLVGLRPYQLRSTPYELWDDLPFVVFSGGRGLGKSALLAEVRAAYQGHTPVALIDGEEPQFARPPAERPGEAWSPVAQGLTTVAEQLAEPVTGARRIGFPARVRAACRRRRTTSASPGSPGSSGRWAGRTAV